MSDEEQSVLRCQWCSAVSADPRATNCAACGAALILRESIGKMVIPGVTDLDPDLKVYQKKPLRIPRGSPSHYVAGNAMSAAAADPTGMLAFGALAAVAAKEFVDATQGRSNKAVDPERVGVPSEAVVEMVNKLNEKERAAMEAAPPPDAPTTEG
jgi:hypothetical protein